MHLYYVDLKSFIEYAGKILKFTYEFGLIYLNQHLDYSIYKNKKRYYDLIKLLESLSYQVSLGLDKNLVFLAKIFKDFDESTLKTIYNGGFTDKASLNNLNASDLSKLASISRSDAEKILKKIKRIESF
jgi:hypothetical protein